MVAATRQKAGSPRKAPCWAALRLGKREGARRDGLRLGDGGRGEREGSQGWAIGGEGGGREEKDEGGAHWDSYYGAWGGHLRAARGREAHPTRTVGGGGGRGGAEADA